MNIVAVLLYGDYPELADRVLRSIYNHTPVDQFGLVIGCNAVSDATMDVINTVLADKTNVVNAVINETNRLKYPCMRQMLYSSAGKPFFTDSTNLYWFDDDSYPTKDDWMQRTDAFMTINNADMIGQVCSYPLSPGQMKLISGADWFKGKQFHTNKFNQALSIFARGGYWACKTSTFYSLDWPDKSILHNYGDVLFGEALHQNGCVLRGYDYGVVMGDTARRGVSEDPI